LLFEWKEAARIPTETIRMLALEGLEQLTQVDSRLGKYGPILLSETQVARHLMTKDQNKDLDVNLSAFLSLISPFFLLGGAHKVMEYLIRRFQYVLLRSAQTFVYSFGLRVYFGLFIGSSLRFPCYSSLLPLQVR
jgi:hypothetical protein